MSIIDARDMEEEANRIKMATVIAIVGYAIYLISDYSVAPDRMREFVAVRVVACALMAAVGIVSRRRCRSSTRVWSVLLFVIVCSSITILCIIAGGAKSRYHEPLALIFVYYAGFMPTSYPIAIVLFPSATALFQLSMVYFGVAGSFADSVQNVSLLTLSSTIGIMFIWGNGKLERREVEAKAKEQEALRDLARSNESLKLAVDEVNIANLKLRQLDVLKNESFANLSHDFRTPISFVKNTVQAALTYPSLDEGLRKLMTIAERYCKQSLGMINDLLDLTKLDNGTEPLVRSCFDMCTMVREISAHSVLLTEKRRIKISFMEHEQRSVLVLANHKLVERACTNLVSNAIKYTDDGGMIETTVFVNEGKVYVEVQDTGIGIKPENHDRVFGRFVQIKTEGRASRGGVGLGLGYVKSVANTHGGDTTISSDGIPGKGSKIGFWLPLPTSTELGASKALTAGGDASQGDERSGLADWAESESDRNAYRFQGIEDAAEMRVLSRETGNPDALKILIVEDNDNLVKGMESFLAAEYHLRRARNGFEGVALMDRFRPDLVITDVDMPGMGGEEMLRAMRQHAYGGTIPIVVLTAKGLDKDRTRLTAAGADAFLLKGCDIDELKAVLRTKLGRHVSTRKMVDDERMLAFRAASIGIAHEIKNPLNLLTNYNDQIHRYLDKVMANPDAPAWVKELVAKALKALDGSDSNCERAKTCCETLRDISKGKEHEMPLSLGSINDVAARAVASTDTKHNMIVHLRACKSTMMNPSKLEQVIVNLSVNAHQACGDTYTKPIEISTRDSDDGKHVELIVKDFGPGMSEELKERIFLPFFTTKATGTGIGLHVCRHILASHSGTLTVQSKEGEGATFTVRLPVAGNTAGENRRPLVRDSS